MEDNRINQMVATEILAFAGAEVDLAENGLEALEKIKKRPYDAVLMDMQMPELDGMEATRIIRNAMNLKSISIIAMTAHAMEGDREMCLSAGMDDYIPKPIDRDALLKVLGRHLFRQGQKEKERGGLDVASGVARIGGNMEVYKKIVHAFAAHCAGEIDGVRRLVEDGSCDAAAKMAHGIKGASANISAEELSSCARALEEALETSDGPGQKVAMEALEEAFSGVVRAASGL